eukprot:3585936-Heterocapsa_arctica.AAC.1
MGFAGRTRHWSSRPGRTPWMSSGRSSPTSTRPTRNGRGLLPLRPEIVRVRIGPGYSRPRLGTS